MKDTQKQTKEYALKSLFAGGIAGCCAKTVIAPIDRIKILFQTCNQSFMEFQGIWLLRQDLLREHFKLYAQYFIKKGPLGCLEDTRQHSQEYSHTQE
jgi:hypothetical protein